MKRQDLPDCMNVAASVSGAWGLDGRLKRLVGRSLAASVAAPLRTAAIVLALIASVLTAHGQGQALRWIDTADEFLSPSTGNLALHSVAGVTEQGAVVGFVGYFPDEFERVPTAVGWRWTPEAGFTFSPPSEATSPTISALNAAPYPYTNATQHGLAFHSVEPAGQILAVASDNRTESPGITSFFSRDPITTHRALRWLDGVNAWLPFVNHPAAAADGMVYHLEQYDYDSIWPGQFILGRLQRTLCRATNFVANPPYWNWAPIQGEEPKRFLLHPSGLRENYTGPAGWPEDPGALSVESVNRSGRSVGVVSRKLPGSQILEWTGLYWENPGQPRLISDVVGRPALPVHITAAGEIVGVAPAVTEPRFLSELAEGRLFVWLPKPVWGLPAGLNWLTHDGSQAKFTGMNDRGMLVYRFLSGTNQPGPYLWSSGVRRTWSTLLATTNWTEITPLSAPNGKGWLVCAGYRTDNGATDYLLSRPLLELDLVTTTNRARVSEQFDLVATVRSYSSQTITNFAPLTPPQIVGETNAIVIGAADPGTPQTLPPGGQLTFRWRCRAIESGEARFAVQLVGNENSLFYRTLKVTCDPVTVAAGDLLIKRAVESASQFGIDNEYQSNPSGAQVRTNTVTQSELSEFQVRLQNDDAVPRSFRLKIRENDVEGWRLSYLFNGGDISSGLRSAGMVFPELATNASHTVTVQMTPTNAVPNEPARVLLQLQKPAQPGEILDIVEAVTEYVPEIVVNSTGDEPDADVTDLYPDVDLNKPGLQTTLRCAIDFANRRPGKDIIKFNIQPEGNAFEDGVPLIQPKTHLVEILGPVVIDGWSQDTNSPTPPVQINGGAIPLSLRYLPSFAVTPPADEYAWPQFGAGLVVVSTGTELRGLCISQFAFGVVLVGGANIVQGCHLGTDPTGTRPKANSGHDGRAPWFSTGLLGAPATFMGGNLLIQSPANLIGGPSRRLGNLISGQGGYYPWGVAMEGSPTGAALGEWMSPQRQTGIGPGIILDSHDALGNVIQGNIIGLDRSGTRRMPNPSPNPARQFAGILQFRGSGTRVGGAEPGAGNVISDNYVNIVLLGEGGHRVEGNRVGTDITGTRVFDRSELGIAVGDHSTVTSNVVHTARGNGIEVGGRQVGVIGNLVGVEASALSGTGVSVAGDGHRILNNQIRYQDAGIVFGNNLHDSNQDNLIAGNLIQSNRFTGIHLTVGRRSRITQNAIADNGQRWWRSRTRPPLGIALEPNWDPVAGDPTGGVTLNDLGDFDDGPNALLNFPVIGRTVADGQALRAEASLDTSPGIRAYTIEFFASRAAGVIGFGEGERYLGAASATTDISGRAFVTFSAGAASPGEYLTATTTDAEGNTSEFSRAVLIQGPEDLDEDGISEAVEIQVPNGAAGSGGGSGDTPGMLQGPPPPGPDPAGDGNGDGIRDAEQAHVASFPSIRGTWWTLAAPEGVRLNRVEPGGPPDFSQLPAGYEFPVGFVGLALSDLAPGSTLILTNIIHAPVEVTTALAFGSAPDDSAPHWHEVPLMRLSGLIGLRLTDGGVGDTDRTADGTIRIAYGLAARVPPPPALALLSSAVTFSAELEVEEINGEPVVVTNQVPTVTSVFGWPASATDWALEYTERLSLTNTWRPVFGSPSLQNEMHVMTNTASSSTRYYRLRRF